MIYFRIFGGLGNQMFQMSAAYALALQKKTEVGVCLDRIQKKVEHSAFTNRQFELDRIFDLKKIQIVSPEKLNVYLDKEVSFSAKLKRKLIKYSLFTEKNLCFDSTLFDQEKEAVIDGYFQSDGYFQIYTKEIRELFQFNEFKISAKTKECLVSLNQNALAIHVRRGDYVNNPEINAVHGSCNLDYYQRGLKQLDANNELGDIYIFSDDPEWVKENISFNKKTIVVDWNGGDDSWQDMFLMSKCKYFIIANSSFSWWGAYLSNENGKQVIAPKRWFADEVKNQQTSDLIPTSWLKI